MSATSRPVARWCGMGRIGWIAAIAASALMLTGTAHAECTTTPDGARSSAAVETVFNGEVDQPHTVRTAIVLCDRRTGRERRMRESAMSETAAGEGHPALPLHGRRFFDADVANGRVAWAQLDVSGAPARSTITIREARTDGRAVRSTVALRELAARRSYASAAISSRGDLAWALGRGGYDRGVWVWRTHGRPQRVAAGIGDQFAFVGDSLFPVKGAPSGFVEVRKAPVRNGCPRRPGFAYVTASRAYLITSGRFVVDGHAFRWWRACVRGSGRDRVIGFAEDGRGGLFVGDVVRLLALVGSTAVFDTRYDAGHMGGTPYLLRVDVRTGKVTESIDVPEWPDLGGRHEVVVLPDGSIVWIAALDGATVRLARPGAAPIALDRGTDIRGLTASGTTVRWLHDGQPRSYQVDSAPDA